MTAAQAAWLAMRSASATFAVAERKDGSVEVTITERDSSHRDRVRLARDGSLIDQAREENS